MKSKLFLFVNAIICSLLFSFAVNAQTPGLIYKPSSTSFGKSVLNPGGSGYISANPGGFTGGVDYGTASELQMISIPFLGLEPPNDLKTGAGFGHTDIVRNSLDESQSQSVYVLVVNVSGVDYLVVRFRIGKASTASKGYSLLMDTDQNFSGSGPNPGFEYEVVLETGFRVAVYNHVAQTVQSFNINEYSQRSIAASTVGGSLNYFYDFFIPLSALGPDEPVRFAAVTITSAQSGTNGTISDVDGVDDKKYANNTSAILKAMINAFPPTQLSTLTTGGSFAPAYTSAPAITSKLTVASTSVSGTSQENDGTTINVYKNGSPIGSTSVSGNAWTLNGVSDLLLGDIITARATASGKSQSGLSNEVEVTGVELCYVPAPVVTARNNGSRNVSGTWSNGETIQAGSVKIRVYQQTAKNTFIQLAQKSGSLDTVVQTNGTWVFDAVMAQSDFGKAALYITAELNGCVSRYSNVSQGNTGTLTTAPTITTTTILASTDAVNVTVRNDHNASATLILYINGNFIDSSATMIASGSSHIFSYSGFIEGERVTARAQANGSNTVWLSNTSNTVIVTTNAEQTSAPVIEGQYIAGSGKTVTGTSTEAPGTIINLYIGGSTLIGTTTVDAFGVWEVTGLTLSTGNVLSATAQAIGKTVSIASNEVTVAASIPGAPTVTGSYQAGATSVSGTGGQGTITVYVDDSPIGTTSGASWTLSDIPSNQLYKGAKIKATNTVSGIESDYSNEVTVTGVSSFLITATNDASVPDQTAGIAFDVKFTAKDGIDGTGSTVTTFTGTVVVASTSIVTNGGGETTGFSSGILTPHNMTLITAGTGKIIEVVSTEDPTAFGTTTLDIFAGAPSTSNSTITADPLSIAADGIESSTITVQLIDAFDNELSTGGDNVTISTSRGSLSGVTDNNNGTYTATLVSLIPGSALLSAKLDGVDIEDNVTVSLTSEYDIYFSINGGGNWNEAGSWSTEGHDGSPAGNPPGEDAICFIGDNDTIFLNANIVNNGIIYIENTGMLMTGMRIISGTGDFELMAGGTLGLGSPGGINGNIKVSGAHNFSPEGNMVFYYNGNQNVGNGAPITVNNMKITGGAVKNMVGDVAVDGEFLLEEGSISIGANTLTLHGDIIHDGGKFIGSANSDLIITNTATFTGLLTFDDQVNNGTKVNNIITAIDVTLGSFLDVTNDMIIESGNFSIGPNQLRIGRDLIIDEGNLIGGTESRIQVVGNGDQLSLPEIDLAILIVNRPAGIRLLGPVNILSSVRLTQGTVINSSNILLAENARIQVTDGSFDAPPVFNNTRVDYIGNSERTTSVELPSSPTPIWKLNIDNSAGIVLNSDIVVNNWISLINGSLNINGKSITLALPNKTVIEETATNRIYGTSGSISVNAKIKTEEINYDPWNLGLKFTVEKELKNSTITRMFAPYTIAGGDGILRSYELKLKKDLNSGLNATIVFVYRNDELNGNNENNLKLYSTNSLSKTWKVLPNQILDTENNTITVTGLDALPTFITARGIGDGGDNIVINDPQQNENMERVKKEMTRDEKRSGKENTREKRSIEENEVEVVQLPSDFDMVQNYPNPFNPVTTLKFAIPESDFVTVKVFDITGREIAELVNGTLNAGYHTVQFNGINLSSGIYFYRITTGSGFSKIMKMSLIK